MPDWDNLFSIAQSQGGYFTTEQAGEAGYSRALLAYHRRVGKILRLGWGVYRLAYYPQAEDEDLLLAWLWSKRQGVFSHDTALSLLELSDALPTSIHLTLPLSWKKRRLEIQENLVLYYADVPEQERTWVGSLPVTKPARTLRDCAKANLSLSLLVPARNQAVSRGLVSRAELSEVDQYLASFHVELV
jgi:predicted transcriptional regulator of viral defense system